MNLNFKTVRILSIVSLLCSIVFQNIALASPRDELISALRSDNREKIASILASRQVDINFSDQFTNPMLIIAISYGSTHGVEQLLAAGANVNQVQTYGEDIGRTPLVAALTEGHSNGDIIQRILSAPNVNLEAADADGKTALFIAARARAGNYKVKKLLRSGANVNHLDRVGNNVLMNEAKTEWFWGSDQRIIDEILSHNIDINHVNDFGHTALMLAAKEGKADFVKSLIVKGADINKVDPDGHTALAFAEQGLIAEQQRRPDSRQIRNYRETIEMLRNFDGYLAKKAAKRVSAHPESAILEALEMYGHDVISNLFGINGINKMCSKQFARGFMLHCQEVYEGSASKDPAALMGAFLRSGRSSGASAAR